MDLPMVVTTFPALAVRKTYPRSDQYAGDITGREGALKQTSPAISSRWSRSAARIRIWCCTGGYDENLRFRPAVAGADGGIGGTCSIMGWRYRYAGVREGAMWRRSVTNRSAIKVIDLLIKTGVFRGLKTVLHYMDVVSRCPLCRKPFAPVDEKIPAGAQGAGSTTDGRKA